MDRWGEVYEEKRMSFHRITLANFASRQNRHRTRKGRCERDRGVQFAVKGPAMQHVAYEDILPERRAAPQWRGRGALHGSYGRPLPVYIPPDQQWRQRGHVWQVIPRNCLLSESCSYRQYLVQRRWKQQQQHQQHQQQQLPLLRQQKPYTRGSARRAPQPAATLPIRGQHLTPATMVPTGNMKPPSTEEDLRRRRVMNRCRSCHRCGGRCLGIWGHICPTSIVVSRVPRFSISARSSGAKWMN
ncbi:uncharacterized protein LOC124722374 [Schistocerca piceifrons]|uniref:uncharacterized protein LOC124722374 n=1 Tax=Schistocerca piceifrons TaxID=274613 RepID=UPI001F5FA6CE|nr:uncharacterized protein LOC124722374 [Schistocerca piceifrons]